jgi:uncharacterized membrane protein
VNKWSLRVRRWFIAGLVLLAPLYVTLFVLHWIFEYLDGPVRNAIRDATGYDWPGIGVVATLLLIMISGAIGSSLVFRGIGSWLESLLDRIPLVRTLYGAVKQLISPFGDEEKNPFQHVVMVEFPDGGMYSLGFLIKENAATGPDGTPLSIVMVPTNHVYLGHVGLYPSSRIHPVDMGAEEALKYLVSMGNALDRRVQLGPGLVDVASAIPK